jgi:site-specific recombinase
MANYFENNFGGLAGNFALGVFLGSTGAIGFTLGLPLDIRHITFASGNFGIAVASLPYHISSEFWINSILGIISIGIMNVIVSFGLSIAFALKSRNAQFSEVRSLIGNLSWHFFHHGSSFFFPGKSSIVKDPDLPAEFHNKSSK